VIETTRLTLRPFEETDVEAAFQWFSDPIVMRFTPSGPDASVEQTRARLLSYRTHQARHGFSKWALVDRSSSRIIGDSGLLVLDEEEWIDLGFRLSRAYWGKGFATEAASAWVRAAFEKHHLPALGAFAHPDNLASLRVLDKLGFRRVRQGTVMGMEAIVFALSAAAFRRGAGARLTTA
jgi:ribosomal-protein-alanine N-acetyltransferase